VFALCPFFVVVDTEGGEVEAVQNLAAMQVGSAAGISSAKLVGNAGAQAVVTMQLGTNEFCVLEQMGIEVYQGVNDTVEENIKLLEEGKLVKMGLSECEQKGMPGQETEGILPEEKIEPELNVPPEGKTVKGKK
jgi:predicted Fe-Mo cluster-binding NifX family protein